MKKRVLVVGGGIAGMVAALRARRLGCDVILVEKQPALGGLLRSVQPWGDEHWFDHGTHIPAATGHSELDRVLFGGLQPEEWVTLPLLKAGTFWNGALQPHSPCLDLRSLPQADYERVLPDMIRPVAGSDRVYQKLSDQIGALYGPAMLQLVFEPILHKFYGVGAEELAPNAHLLFGLIRFICLDPETTRVLKQTPALDRKIGFHSYSETPSGSQSHRCFYPRRGGVGRWVNGLQGVLREEGVVVRTEASVKALNLECGRAILADDRLVAFDELAWCLPAGMLLRQIGHPLAARLPAPSMSAGSLYHFVIDRPVLTDAYYVTCYDPNRRSFRVTLYDNFQPRPGDASRITVEVLSPVAGMAKPTEESVFGELKGMGIVAPDAALCRSRVQDIAGAFPIPTQTQQSDSRLALAAVAEDCPTVRLLGRAAGNHFFMKDVLLEAWNYSEAGVGKSPDAAHFADQKTAPLTAAHS